MSVSCLFCGSKYCGFKNCGHVFRASANHPGPLGHPAHAARAGRRHDGAAGLRSPAAQRSALPPGLKSAYVMLVIRP